MAAARPFGMEGVDGASANGRQRIFNKPDSFRVSLCSAT
jgi:hypothetical protein